MGVLIKCETDQVAYTANTNSESRPPSRPAHTISQSERNPSDSQGQRQDLPALRHLNDQ
jgi:hypothetical protein